MKALVLQDKEAERIILKDVPTPKPQNDEVLVKIKTASLNHRDQWCREGLYPQLTYPSILGSDACGMVEEVGNQANNHWIGKEVILNPNVDWGENPEVPSQDYTILGMPTNGTLAEYLLIPIHRLHPKPSHLTSEEASAIPLAGLTAFRCVFKKGGVKKNQNVLITGIGGGVALFALQFCVAIGAKVYVTSSSEEKIQKALTLGAFLGIHYHLENWTKTLQKECPKGFDGIIDGAGGKDFGHIAKMLAPNGNMVVYGTTAGNPSPIHLPRLFFSQGSIKGSTMGNDEEFKAMLEFVAKHQIHPVISSVRPFEDVISAFDEMKAGKQFGKLVVKM
jgi:zinc-binding alcohol dehydrogenase/oxidoreductase